MADVVVADNLTKSYGTRRGVVELTFSVAPGEVFGYLGPNGAGKTTTIRTLLDFLRPTSGRASLFGLDSHGDGVSIHARVGYLPGEFSLYDQMTGGEYLSFLGNLRGGVPAADVAALAERLDLDAARARVHAEHRRAALGRADEVEERADRRRLAGAVRPEVAEDLAGMHLELQIHDTAARAVGLRQVLGDDHGYVRAHGAILAGVSGSGNAERPWGQGPSS